jgi:hypothetical protein
MKQEYTSAHTYKLNLHELIIQILQFKVLNLIHQSLHRKLSEGSESELSTVQRQHLALKMSSSERLEPRGRAEPPTHS